MQSVHSTLSHSHLVSLFFSLCFDRCARVFFVFFHSVPFAYIFCCMVSLLCAVCMLTLFHTFHSRFYNHKPHTANFYPSVHRARIRACGKLSWVTLTLLFRPTTAPSSSILRILQCIFISHTPNHFHAILLSFPYFQGMKKKSYVFAINFCLLTTTTRPKY